MAVDGASNGAPTAPRIEWAMDIILREMRRGLHGHVALHMQAGVIVRVEVKSTEMPEPPGKIA